MISYACLDKPCMGDKPYMNARQAMNVRLYNKSRVCIANVVTLHPSVSEEEQIHMGVLLKLSPTRPCSKYQLVDVGAHVLLHGIEFARWLGYRYVLARSHTSPCSHCTQL